MNSKLGLQQPRSKRLAIGFLSENAASDSESVMIQGAMDAAEKLDVNFIYFGNYQDFYQNPLDREEQISAMIRSKHEQIRTLVDQFDVDGLLFIGWSPDIQLGNLRSFQESYQGIPLLSLGAGFEQIPSVYVDGYYYVKEMTNHLIEAHGYQKIAFVEPWNEDSRIDAYSETVQNKGFYDRNLLVTRKDLTGSHDFYVRTKRSIEILMDERGIRPDAIFVMTAMEGKFALEFLKERGIRVPEDVAVVCYEDHDANEFTTPPMTSIYFPYRELGYAGCAKLIRLIRGEALSFSSAVPARVNTRDSCGCTVNKVRQMELENDDRRYTTPVTLYGPETLQREMAARHPYVPLDYAGLAAAFLQDVGEAPSARFLPAFQQGLSTFRPNVNVFLQETVEDLRSLLLPWYQADQAAYIHGEELWHAARYMAKDWENAFVVSRYIRNDEVSKMLGFIGKQLISSYTVQGVPEVLNRYLGWMQIPTSYIFLHEEGKEDFDGSRLIFSYHEHEWKQLPDEGVQQAYQTYKRLKEKRFSLFVIPLHIQGEQIGIAWMEPGPNNSGTIVSLCSLLSIALKGSILIEESQNLVRQLTSEIILRKEKEAELAYHADTDELTRLYNRRFFYEAIHKAAHGERPFSIFYIDIDDFKQVNDTFGHDMGDQLLVQIADRISIVLKEQTHPPEYTPLYDKESTDAIFRLGGDEFTAMLKEVRPSALAELASKLTETVRLPYTISGHELHISCSIGISMYPTDAEDELKLLKFADMAMYKAKSTKDTYMFHSQISQEEIHVS